MLIARNPTTYIYEVFLFSAGSGDIPLYIPDLLQSFLGGSRLGVREWVGLVFDDKSVCCENSVKYRCET